MEFIESPIFSKILEDYLSDDEYAALQWDLISRPNAGKIIPGSGGLRKLRWQASGRGKSGDTGSYTIGRIIAGRSGF